jgi:hypothetical protein
LTDFEEGSFSFLSNEGRELCFHGFVFV